MTELRKDAEIFRDEPSLIAKKAWDDIMRNDVYRHKLCQHYKVKQHVVVYNGGDSVLDSEFKK